MDYESFQNKKLNKPRYECVSDRTVLALEILMKQNGLREKAALARKVGLSREYISMLLNQRLKPTLSQAQMITGAFNLRVQDIFDLSDIRDLNLGFQTADEVAEDNNEED